MVSHHKAINLLLKKYEKKLKYSGPSYCATLCFHTEFNANFRGGYTIKKTEVVYK